MKFTSIVSFADTLDSKMMRNVAIASFVLLVIAVFSSNARAVLALMVVTLLAAAFNFVIHKSTWHFHLGHVLVLTLVIGYTFGLHAVLFFVLVAHVLPEMLTVHIDQEMVVLSILYVLAGGAASLMGALPIHIVGITLSAAVLGLMAVIRFTQGIRIQGIFWTELLELAVAFLVFSQGSGVLEAIFS